MGCYESRSEASSNPLNSASNPFYFLDITLADKLVRKFAPEEVMTETQFGAFLKAAHLPSFHAKDCVCLEFAEVPGGVSRIGLLVATIMTGSTQDWKLRLRLLFEVIDDRSEGRASKEKVRMLVALMIKAAAATSQDGTDPHLAVSMDIDEAVLEELAKVALNSIMSNWAGTEVSAEEFERKLEEEIFKDICTVDGMRRFLSTEFDIEMIVRRRRGSIQSSNGISPPPNFPAGQWNEFQAFRKHSFMNKP